MTTKEASERIFQDHNMHSHHLFGDNAEYSMGGGGGMEYYYPMFQMWEQSAPPIFVFLLTRQIFIAGIQKATIMD